MYLARHKCVYICIYMCTFTSANFPSSLDSFKLPSPLNHPKARHWRSPCPPWQQQQPARLCPGTSTWGLPQGRCCRGLPIARQTCKKYSLRILTYQNPGPPFSLGASFVLVPSLEKLGTGASPVITRSKGPLSLSLTLAFLKVG